ncbi:MAG: hypothetical protein U9O95_08160 [Candidatus Marinimicrobia bacterium]|nr:hypothetical protein [Candidatus Neomarinimicrobiota bacterium]
MKIKLNKLTWCGMDELDQLVLELRELEKEKTKSSLDLGIKEIEILYLLTSLDYKNRLKGQIECELDLEERGKKKND